MPLYTDLRQNHLMKYIANFVIILITFTSCFSDKKSTETAQSEEQTQQQFTAQSIENAEEPEFVIEAEYDPALAEKAEKSKRAKQETTSPITLTSDDGDLQQEQDDLPAKVTNHTVSAYDYENTKEHNILNDPDFVTKGADKPSVLKSQKEEALYFVVAGVYKDAADANKKLKAIENLGYKAEIISFDDNFKTVCVAKLESRTQADFLAKTLKVEKIDAYVVKRRK